MSTIRRGPTPHGLLGLLILLLPAAAGPAGAEAPKEAILFLECAWQEGGIEVLKASVHPGRLKPRRAASPAEGRLSYAAFDRAGSVLETGFVTDPRSRVLWIDDPENGGLRIPDPTSVFLIRIPYREGLETLLLGEEPIASEWLEEALEQPGVIAALALPAGAGR